MNLMKKLRGMRLSMLIVLGAVIFCMLAGGGIAIAKYAKATQVREELSLGNKYLQEGKYQEAILAFEKVIKIEPKNIEARVQLAKIYILTSRPGDAEKLLKEAIDINPQKVEPWLELAKLYVSQNNPAEAIKVLTDGYKATGDDRIKSMLDELQAQINVDDITSTVITGESYSLPSQVTVKVNGASVEFPVKWDNASVDTSREGTQTFSGTLENTDKVVRVTLNIVSITSIGDITASVKQNDKYSLPSKVTAKMSDNSSREVDVTWNPGSVDTSKLGNYTFEGSVKGHNAKVKLSLTVVAPYTKGEELQLYAKLLKDTSWQKKNGIIFYDGKSTLDQHFFVDLDQDGIFEMLVHHGSSMADMTVSVIIYNYGNVKIQHLPSDHGGYAGYSKSTKVFFLSGMNQGWIYSAGYKLVNGVCSRVITFIDNENDITATEAVYKVNDKQVSHSEYQKAWAAYGKIE